MEAFGVLNLPQEPVGQQLLKAGRASPGAARLHSAVQAMIINQVQSLTEQTLLRQNKKDLSAQASYEAASCTASQDVKAVKKAGKTGKSAKGRKSSAPKARFAADITASSVTTADRLWQLVRQLRNRQQLLLAQAGHNFQSALQKSVFFPGAG